MRGEELRPHSCLFGPSAIEQQIRTRATRARSEGDAHLHVQTSSSDKMPLDNNDGRIGHPMLSLSIYRTAVELDLNAATRGSEVGQY